MRIPVRWLREYVDIPLTESARDIAERLVRAGLEVESVETIAVEGPLVVGRVLDFVDEPQKNGKTIRWCQVDVGALNPPGERARGIVCGAHNFAVGDTVVVALAGSTLPGGFAIAARKTYGHISDGMICSVKELGVGEEHDGIYVVPAGAADAVNPGDDANELMGLPESVLDIAVTPDRGYCLSLRGVAREAATAYGLPFRDPAKVDLPQTAQQGHDVALADPKGADRIVLRRVVGFDPAAKTPTWLANRLHLAGMRPISLAVDVTNYVMLELGQPLHAFDAMKLAGPIVVRRAAAGERLTTLDGQDRVLDPEDLLITDDSGPIALAGTMGGAATEVSASTHELVIEAAHFLPVVAARQSRRHKLSSEASRRFERGVDSRLPPAASARACQLLSELGGATYVGATDVDARVRADGISIPVTHPGRVAGLEYADEIVIRRLEDVGCAVEGPDDSGMLTVLAPSWRPDLTDPNDLAEEVIRLEGYDRVPSTLRPTPPGRGLAAKKRHGLMVSRALAGAGLTEVRCYPFVGAATLDALGIPADDERRRLVRLANPLSDEEPFLRSGLMQALIPVVQRNVSRGFKDVAVYEVGRVALGRTEVKSAPRPPVDRRPTQQELAAIDEALPDQPAHVAAVLTGQHESDGWWGRGRPVTWADAVELARETAQAIDAPMVVRPAQRAPWHPGRCAELLVDGGSQVQHVGHAGELHPKVCEAFGLPARSVAFEIDLTSLAAYAEELDRGPTLSTYPVAHQDVALVVDEAVRAADVESALRAGAGDLLESLRLFDVYRDDRLGTGRKSLAYALRFRAPDRTLTVEEVSAARDAACNEASTRVGAVLRT